MKLLPSLLASAVAVSLGVSAFAQLPGRVFATGNVIFFHPDGSGLNHWQAARQYWVGPDSNLNWDRLPHMAAYRGHMSNVLGGTSNGGATTHAFGYKVDGLGSFGQDGDGNLNPPTNRAIRALGRANDPLGFPGSIMREAANARGMPVGILNDGNIGEPGTGAFLAEVGNRDNWQAIVLQILRGRDGTGATDVNPWVIFGGGEADMVPTGVATLHRNHLGSRGQAVNHKFGLRTDSRNLLTEMQAAGYRVVMTRAEFEQLRTDVTNATGPTDANWAPRVLGVFAWHHLFNDRNEEDLIARGFRNLALPVDRKESNLVLWGDFPRTVAGDAPSLLPTDLPGFNPPTFAEMMELTLRILDRRARQVSRPFLLVAEQESVDNFGNSNNAIGMLNAMRDTDAAFGHALSLLTTSPRTLIITAADSDASGLQVAAVVRSGGIPGVTPPTTVVPPGGTPDNVGTVSVNPVPTASGPTVSNPLDGLYGRGTRAFLSAPDQFDQVMQFGLAWTGTPDFGGAIVTRAAGLNSGLLTTQFSARLDNIDIYRMMYLTLFGQLPAYPTGDRAPPR